MVDGMFSMFQARVKRKGAGFWFIPRGPIYTTIMELGPQNHNGDGLLQANSKIVVYMDPLGLRDRPTNPNPSTPGLQLLSAGKAHVHHIPGNIAKAAQ